MNPWQLIKYGSVGLISTAIHFCCASLFAAFIKPSLLLSNLSGFSIAFIWSYLIQSRFVFHSNLSLRKGVKFLIVQVASLLLAVQIADLSPFLNIYVKTFLVSVFLPLTTFFIHKFWTFLL